MFGTPSSTPAFGTPSSTPPFGTPSSTPLFGTPSTPAFATGGFGSSLFSTPLASQTQQQQQQTLLFQQPSTTGFGFQQQQQQNPFAMPLQTTPFPSPPPPPQLSTQMALVAPLPFSLADRDIQAIVDAYKEDPGNLKYAFKYLLLSVTEPQHRGKLAGVSDIMWAESMAKLEGMEGTDRERLWPQLVQGFKDLSHRLKVAYISPLQIAIPCKRQMQLKTFKVLSWKLQDEVIVSDAERLRMTQSNIKMLQRHFQAVALPRIERMRQKEQSLQRHLLRISNIPFQEIDPLDSVWAMDLTPKPFLGAQPKLQIMGTPSHQLGLRNYRNLGNQWITQNPIEEEESPTVIDHWTYNPPNWQEGQSSNPVALTKAQYRMRGLPPPQDLDSAKAISKRITHLSMDLSDNESI
ncbi:hypothetical protein POTOM_032109 [Populus tomentosa]|uniref:Nucleoporin Nup54 alpha-helical domain-containing protein n=1 Tax=Populus tomentosa TaxID=118781 RepID=A0A8X8CSA9_POPTO|nr:hypothetical protein POTOM_032109 [Populus tomentosa]